MALKIPPPILLLLFGSAVYLLGKFFPQGEAQIHYQYQFYACAFLALIAFALDLPALLSFLTSKTTISPLSPAKATTLVTTGVYGFTRNPMYLGMALLLLAWIIYLGNWSGLLMWPLFIAYLTKFQIIPEEEALTRIFGAEYSDYQKQVRRWI